MSITLNRSESAAPITLPENEKLPLGQNIILGLQHILTMYGGVISVPLIVGTAAGLETAQVAVLIAAALFVSGAATILQSLGIPFFGSKLPLVPGVSFAAVSTMTTIASGDGGLQSVFGAVLIAGIFGVVIAPVFSKIVRFFPTVVTGTIITVIGVSLLPVAVRWAMGGIADAPTYGAPSNIALAAVTLVFTLAFSAFKKLSKLAVLLGIFCGTIVAVLTGQASFEKVSQSEIFAFPAPFAFGLPTFEIGAIISMCVVMIVIMTETTADILAVGKIIGTDVNEKRVADGLRADAISTAISPLFNSFPASAFAQNVGVVAMTGVRSRFVVATGGGILVVLGLLPILGAVIASVPYPVLGGAAIVLFGSVAASGIQSLATVDYSKGKNSLIVATSIAFGLIPIAVPAFYDQFPTWFALIFDSGISATAIAAFSLNLAFNELPKSFSTSKAAVLAPAAE
ncbi:nucleobase:cation symporter-2 family protein [Rothia aerolata]|uniref:Uracil permease n=1 Tax=Rothia aerolata TaxID=1812262 RepID=A0A917MV03_9MICC|nr:nucleobase:cation symporter-2 family protein [Rothia aerolata]GGH65786.1 uracil permease [Rothia aerolata]